MFFKRKNNEYNFWLLEEINRCKKFNKDLTKWITPNTHPLHAKWIAKALINDLDKEDIAKISAIKYKDESEVQKMYEDVWINPKLSYFLENFKPKNIVNDNVNSDGYLGAILDDMIGTKYEFIEHDEIIDLYNKLRFSDDSVLTVATKMAIQENNKNPDFAKWYKFFFNNYRNAGYGSGFVRWCIEDLNCGYGSFGNGSAMRVSPIACYYNNIEDVIINSFKSAIVTHNHLEGIKGAVITAVIQWMCKNNYTKEEIKEYLYEHYYYTAEQFEELEYAKIIFNLELGDNNRFDGSSLLCSFAVPYAIWCFLETDSFDSCMNKILSHFCDADTICAIAGPCAYMYYKIDKKEIIKEHLGTLDKYLDLN